MPGGPSVLPALEGRGPLFMKIGEYLALRPDLLPADDVEQLLRLVDDAPPSPWEHVQQSFLRDFGTRPENMFDWIDPSPLASGALAEVYSAQTAEGDAVAVKVLRPDIAATLDHQLKDLDKVVRAIDDVADLGSDGRKHLEADIRSWFADQTDLEKEYRNAVRLHDIDLKDQRFRFPEPLGDYSSAHVLTTEYLRGVPFTEILPVPDERRGQGFAERGLSRHDLGDNLVESVLQQAFALGLFHAGPHPVNLLALPGNEIGFVGLGFVSRIDSTERNRQLALIASLGTEDTERAARSLADGVRSPDQFRLDQFRSDLLERLRALRREEEISGELALPHHLRAVMNLAREHGVEFPKEIESFYRCLLTAESVATMLSPTSGLRGVGTHFFVRLQVRTAIHQLSFNESRALALDVLDLLTTAPGNIGRLLSDLADDRFVFRVATSEAEEDRRAGHARTRLISMSIVLVALSILVTGFDVGSTVGRVVGYGGLGVASAVLVLLWVRLG